MASASVVSGLDRRDPRKRMATRKTSAKKNEIARLTRKTLRIMRVSVALLWTTRT